MKKAIAMKWVEALESGKYKQGKGRLKRGDSYCCLGVLCEISGLGQFEDDTYLGVNGILPDAVKDFSGARSADGTILSINKRLWFLNDSGSTFSEIAAIIRENWEEL